MVEEEETTVAEDTAVAVADARRGSTGNHRGHVRIQTRNCDFILLQRQKLTMQLRPVLAPHCAHVHRPRAVSWK